MKRIVTVAMAAALASCGGSAPDFRKLPGLDMWTLQNCSAPHLALASAGKVAGSVAGSTTIA
jgi:hypothetical protein